MKFPIYSWARNFTFWAHVKLQGHDEAGYQKKWKITLNHEKKKKKRMESFGNGILFFMQLNNWAIDDDDYKPLMIS